MCVCVCVLFCLFLFVCCFFGLITQQHVILILFASHPICALFIFCLLLFFSGDVWHLWWKGRRCIRQRRLLLSIPSFNDVYTHLHHLVVGHTFSPRQTMQERTTTTVNNKMDMLWQLHYDVWTVTICFQKIVLYFSCTGHCIHFLKCMVPLPLNSSISFPPLTCSLPALLEYWITC